VYLSKNNSFIHGSKKYKKILLLLFGKIKRTMRALMHEVGDLLAFTSSTTVTHKGALLGAKIGSIFALIIVVLLFALIPFRIKRRDGTQPVIFSYLNAFSGGVFLGFAFLHVLPDSVTDYYQNYPSGTMADLPLPFLMCMLGFLAVLLVEKVLYVTLIQRKSENEPGTPGGLALNPEAHPQKKN